MGEPQTACIVVAQRGLGQDRAAVESHAGTTTLVLADGAGGRVGGLRAAELSVTTGLQRMRDADGTTPSTVIRELDQLLLADETAGEATFVLAQVVGQELRGASVGDSGAWLISDATYRDLTHDQTRKPMLGSGDAGVSPFATPIVSETLLIASDGLLKYSSPQTICQIVRSARSLDAAGTQLIDSVRLRSGALQDDTSLILLRRPT
ncbi:MAG: PP2C family protein-serine/threonine phosphatase [Nannocystales bacterium]